MEEARFAQLEQALAQAQLQEQQQQQVIQRLAAQAQAAEALAQGGRGPEQQPLSEKFNLQKKSLG